MKIKKLCGALAVAIALAATSTITQAADYFVCDTTDRESVAQKIEDMAIALRCEGYTLIGQDASLNDVFLAGDWTDDPNQWIWQFKGRNGNGCEVHYKLSKNLHVARQFTDDQQPPDGKKPPRNEKDGVTRNAAQGAANHVRDYKDDKAELKLLDFIDTIDNAARENDNNLESGGQKADFRQDAVDAQGCILGILDLPAVLW